MEVLDPDSQKYSHPFHLFSFCKFAIKSFDVFHRDLVGFQPKQRTAEMKPNALQQDCLQQVGDVCMFSLCMHGLSPGILPIVGRYGNILILQY